MAKWRVVWNGGTSAALFSDQTTLNGLGVVAGVYDDGCPVLFTDPDDPNADWETFVDNEELVPQGIVNLCEYVLPNPGANWWAANYAWDLNQTVGP